MTLELHLEAKWRRQRREPGEWHCVGTSGMLNKLMSHRLRTLAEQRPEMSIQVQMAKGLMRRAKVARFDPDGQSPSDFPNLALKTSAWHRPVI